MKKVYFDPCFTPNTDINSSQIIDLNVKVNTEKLLGKNLGNLRDLRIGEIISGPRQQ